MKLRAFALAVMLVTAGLPATTLADGDGPPLADAGLDQSTTVGSVVYLDGGGSIDPDGEIEAYRWSIDTPSGEQVAPDDPDSVKTQLVPDETGRYAVHLTVTGDDGQTQTDTLYVDVEGEPDGGPRTATATPDQTRTPEATPTPTPDSDPSESTGDDGGGSAATNQPPSGEIDGPSSVTSGSEVTYTIDATDPDGEIVDRWWLPTSLSRSGAQQSDLRSDVRTFTADGTPGTSVQLSAIVVDDDGATSTLTKTVEVRNTPPSASIEGEEMVAVNTTESYQLSASDPDGEITSVSLDSGDGAVEPVESIPWNGPTSSGEWDRSFRFTEIPADDGTVTFEATVRDEHGGVTTVEKEVTVVTEEKMRDADPLAQEPPEILTLDASIVDDPEGINGRQVQLSAEATDPDSERLTFNWRIGDVALLSNRASGSPAQANMSYALEDLQFEGDAVEVSLTVVDQNGHSDDLTKDFEVRKTGSEGGVVGRGTPIQISNPHGRYVSGSYQMDKIHAGERIVISFGDGHSETDTLRHTNTYQFNHKYDSGGRYPISISPAWTSDTATAPVNIAERNYTVWLYEQKVEEVLRTEATTSPGENWTQMGVARVEQEQVGTETMQTLADGSKAITSPGQEWTRVGTTTEYHTERRTTESTSHPGENWTVVEQNVDQERVFNEWQHTTVPKRGLLDGDWEYVETVPKTVDRTETERSADRPDGGSWSKVEQVGQTQVSHRTEWVDYQFHAEPHWEYLGSDRYVSGYETTKTCVEYIQLQYARHCVEEETERDPQYDYRYEYRVPVYDSVYEWERTVEETEYEYRYRSATYSMKDVHRYEKKVRVGTEYAQWEQPVYNTTDIYRWKNSKTAWEESRGFSRPTGEVRNLSKVVKECGMEPAEQEPNICGEE